MKRRWTLAIVITALVVACMGSSIALADSSIEWKPGDIGMIQKNETALLRQN
ncbi:MAG: hypothetical protein IJ662_06815 [Clostridia bacterium]|nr:hypothetical protein [Clostridia bacterium]